MFLPLIIREKLLLEYLKCFMDKMCCCLKQFAWI